MKIETQTAAQGADSEFAEPCRPALKSPNRSPVEPELGRAEIFSVLSYFDEMIEHCLALVEAAKRDRRPVVGIMCEFTPREIILAAGAIPVCLCGGSAETIPAAEAYLPANLCPLIKSTFGYHVTGTNPFLKCADLVVAETTCDGKKKMFELLGASKPMYVLELPQKADDPDAFEHWVLEVRKFKEYVESIFRFGITDSKLRSAVQLMNRERGLRRKLADMMASDPPPLTGRQLLKLRSIISGVEADLRQYGKTAEILEESRKASGPASGTGGKVRVLLTGVPVVHGAERVVELIESCAAVVVCMENCTGLKPILEDVDLHEPDLVRAIAWKYYHLPCSVMTRNERRLELLRALTRKFRPECVIELVWQACLTYDVESYHVRKLVEDELSLPYVKITTDYSPADSTRIVSRVEALVEAACARRGPK